MFPSKRFSIRDLLWLTVVAAVVTMWMVDRGRLEVAVLEQEKEKHQSYGRQVMLAKAYVRLLEEVRRLGHIVVEENGIPTIVESEDLHDSN